MEDQPLAFTATEDLLKELKIRYDQMLFIGFKNSTNKRSDYHCATNAELHEVVGLAHMAMNMAEAAADD
jgi:hypothetical protein